MKIICEYTEHGFKFGAADVSCCCSDDKKGWVVVGLKTKKQQINIYITKTGIIRIHSGAKDGHTTKTQL